MEISLRAFMGYPWVNKNIIKISFFRYLLFNIISKSTKIVISKGFILHNFPLYIFLKKFNFYSEFLNNRFVSIMKIVLCCNLYIYI